MAGFRYDFNTAGSMRLLSFHVDFVNQRFDVSYETLDNAGALIRDFSIPFDDLIPLRDFIALVRSGTIADVEFEAALARAVALVVPSIPDNGAVVAI